MPCTISFTLALKLNIGQLRDGRQHETVCLCIDYWHLEISESTRLLLVSKLPSQYQVLTDSYKMLGTRARDNLCMCDDVYLYLLRRRHTQATRHWQSLRVYVLGSLYLQRVLARKLEVNHRNAVDDQLVSGRYCDFDTSMLTSDTRSRM